MATSGGPNIERDGLVFGMDTGYGVADNNTATRFYPGETTENLIYDMGGTVTSAYPEVAYRSTATETNVVDPSAPGGKYSRFTGIDDSSNNQLYSRFSSYSIDVRGDSVNYSVYLKGSGTCHLTIYDNQSGYGTSSTITLTSDWVRYNYTRTINASATSYWVAVRGVLSTTDVYIAGQQATRGTHSTPYVENNRSATQSLIDLTKTTDIDLSNVSFDSNAQLTFDGTDDRIYIPNSTFTSPTELTIESIFKRTSTLPDVVGCPIHRNDGSNGNVGNSEFTIAVYRDNSYYIYGSIGANTGTATWTNGLTGVVCELDTYYHVVSTWDGTNVRTYVNGDLKVTYSLTTYSNSGGTIRFGASNTSGGTYRWIGELPVNKIYNRALSADEVQQNYNAYKNRFNL